MADNWFHNRTIWITGASSGIGEALAMQAAAAGARVILTARREAELQRVRAACADPGKIAVLPLDLTEFDAEAALATAEAFFGPVDVLVNNAGISQRGTVLQTQEAVYRRIFELDFFACLKLNKAVLPGMVTRQRGHVVTVSSVVGYVGTPMRSGYAAAKHALHGFHDAMRAEVWRDGVKVTLICPGYIRTQVSVNAVTPDGGQHGVMDEGQQRGMAPEVCAQHIWKAVVRGREEVLIGRREAVFVYLRRWFPWLLSFALKRAKVT